MWYKISKHFWRFLSRDILENQNKMAAKVELEIYIRKPRRAVILKEKGREGPGGKIRRSEIRCTGKLSVCLVFSITEVCTALTYS